MPGSFATVACRLCGLQPAGRSTDIAFGNNSPELPAEGSHLPLRAIHKSITFIGCLVFTGALSANAESATGPIDAPASEHLASAKGQESDATSLSLPLSDTSPLSTATDATPPVQTIANSFEHAAGPHAGNWPAFDVGRSWTYVFVQERSRSLGGASPEIEKLRGTRVDKITAEAPEFGQNVIQMQSRMHGRNDGDPGGAETREEFSRFYRSFGQVHQLIAEDTGRTGPGSRGLTQYETPLRMLESGIEVGQEWQVGVRHRGDLHTRLVGELLGVQDVQTPAGLFERCLVVRIRGEISGVIEAYGSRMEVPDGTSTETVWYAPGVGRVLTKLELVQTLILEDGQTLEYSERTQFALRSTEGPTAPASIEAPHSSPGEAAPQQSLDATGKALE